MGNGNDGGEVHDLTIEILKSIRDEIRGVREEVHSVREEVHGVREDLYDEIHGVREDLQDLRTEVRTGFDATNGRLDLHSQALAKLIGEVGSLNGRFDNFLTGKHRDEHEELRSRIERIEERLDKAG